MLLFVPLAVLDTGVLEVGPGGEDAAHQLTHHINLKVGSSLPPTCSPSFAESPLFLSVEAHLALLAGPATPPPQSTSFNCRKTREVAPQGRGLVLASTRIPRGKKDFTMWIVGHSLKKKISLLLPNCQG